MDMVARNRASKVKQAGQGSQKQGYKDSQRHGKAGWKRQPEKEQQGQAGWIGQPVTGKQGPQAGEGSQKQGNKDK
jgi:hypothetical protein